MRIFSLIVLLGLCLPPAFSQQDDIIFNDHVYQPNLASVQFGPTGYQHLFPQLDLGGDGQLLLSFDDMYGEVKNYVYTVVHCDRNWEPSGLSPLEYIDGFEEDDIPTYDFSFRTVAVYTHYELLVPNRNMGFTKSGNYLLIVYEDEYDRIPVITRRFVVVDRQVGVSAQVVRPAQVSQIHTHQEIDFEVGLQGLNSRNAMQEISATIMQNRRWDNAIVNLSPNLTRIDRLSFDYQGRVVFPAGNEFRFIDLRSLRNPHPDLLRIENINDELVEVDLAPEIPRSGAPHLSFTDANGAFFIFNYDFNDAGLNSEYLYTLFTLKTDQPYMEDNVYLFGAFTDWQVKPEYQLRYNPAVSGYVGRFPLKMGVYNYYYVTAPSDAAPGATLTPDYSRTEGNYADTENDYQILIYYRPFGTRYDQIVGTLQFNSLQTTRN
ncbi:MAG: DUF5103 domain-containing protein [Lewinella sp.]|nr:DUF5103 domain-containing protein [Lewinella sp.]